MIAPYYADERVTLYHGDAREIAPLLSERGIVICDPPYSPHTHQNSRAGARKTPLKNRGGRLTKACISRAVDFGFEPISDALRRTLAEQAARLASRWVLFFCDGEGIGPWREELGKAGLENVRVGAWVKESGSPQFTGDRPGVGFEAIVIAHQVDENGRPRKKRWNGGGKRGVWSVATVLERGGSKLGEPRLHETQKPERLMCELIADFTKPDEIVIDFTAGSGTTLVCARRLGRRAVGIERRERDCENAAKRLEAEARGVSFYAAQAGQMGLFA